ncbi:MAG TPA: hypothetical protein VJH37_04530 [Candidatus Nanoarchaeia archaeon]|nr:hypothetical protein [Candidatus Nanoarchaeia archaeon]
MKKTFLSLVICSSLLAILVSAGSFEFRGTTDKMSINEEMGDILEAVTTQHLADLKTGSVSTKEGRTNYAQYLRFKDATTALNTSSVQYTKDTESDEVGEFLVVNSGTTVTDAFFEWHINFDEGLKSKITDGRLDGLDDVNIAILNDDYRIIDSFIEGRKIRLVMAKGAIADILREREKKIYTIGEKTYNVEIASIETATNKVKFKVNGQETSQLEEGNIESIDAGVFIGMNDIITNTNDPQGSGVKFFIGASVIEFIDENYEDDSFTRDVSFNKQKMEDAFIKISASLVGEVLKISSMKYRLTNTKKVYAKPGEGVKSNLRKPEGMLADWDIRFTGFENAATTKIMLISSTANDEYRLEFTTPEDKLTNIPFVSNVGSFKLGDNTKDLIIVEGSSTTDFNIDRNDYFVLTTANTKNGKTYVLTYDSINSETNTITFTEIGGSTRSATYTNGSGSILGEGTISLGIIAAKFYVEAASPNRLAIDLNGDNDVASDQMDIITKGGGILDVGTTNTPSAPYDITLTTDGSQFEETTTSETLTFTIQTSQSTKVGLSETVGNLATVKSNNNHVMGVSNYGVRVDLLASQDKSDSLSLEYPLSQLFAKVVIDVGAGAKIKTKVEDSKETQCTNKKQDNDETGIDCGGSCEQCPTCFDGIKNQEETGIDCGGTCPKLCSPEQPQVSDVCNGCLQTLEKGKKECLSFGAIVGTLYCERAGLLVPLKKNGEVCVENYECKTKRCEEGKCGRKMTVGLFVMNAGMILLILIILYYVFMLLK